MTSPESHAWLLICVPDNPKTRREGTKLETNARFRSVSIPPWDREATDVVSGQLTLMQNLLHVSSRDK